MITLDRVSTSTPGITGCAIVGLRPKEEHGTSTTKAPTADCCVCFPQTVYTLFTDVVCLRLATDTIEGTVCEPCCLSFLTVLSGATRHLGLFRCQYHPISSNIIQYPPIALFIKCMQCFGNLPGVQQVRQAIQGATCRI